MGYDIHGRKRKQVGKRSKKAKPNFAKQTKKQAKNQAKQVQKSFKGASKDHQKSKPASKAAGVVDVFDDPLVSVLVF